MARFRFRPRAPLLVFLGSLSLPLQAQSPLLSPFAEVRSAPEDFGSDPQILVVGHLEFSPRTTAFAETQTNTSTGSKWVSSGLLGEATLWASLNGRIPNGARITEICVYGVDDLAGGNGNVYVQLRRFHADAVGGGDASVEVSSTIASSGAPGSFAVCQAADVLVDSHQDIDGDGAMEVVNYALALFFGSPADFFGDDLQIRFVRITWHRQVSPAPASATFSDVPVGHPFHRFVEALSAAGITAGCAPGLYCVNNPITRGEMAVFLAVALGLHWTAF